MFEKQLLFLLLLLASIAGSLFANLYFPSHVEFRWDIRLGSVPTGFCSSDSELYARIHGVCVSGNLVSYELLVQA